MSLRSLYSASTGMEAHQFSLDTVANNIANASTSAFKKSRANFEDSFYENVRLPGSQTAAGPTAVGTHVGLGTRIASTSLDFSQGSSQKTDGELDLAILGEGFFQVNDNGGLAYTRSGHFTLNANREVVTASADMGRVLQPPIVLPEGAQNISINASGQVNYLDTAGVTQTTGQIQLWRFQNNNGLLQKGESLLLETTASGTATSGIPGTNGFGQLQHGHLEASNVEPVRELVDLIKTQRNFELNSQIIQAADQMLQLISNLRRF